MELQAGFFNLNLLYHIIFRCLYNPCALSACQARLGVGAKVKDLTQYCTRDPDVEVQLGLPKSCVVTGGYVLLSKVPFQQLQGVK